MLRAISVKPKGSWSGGVADSVVLDYDDRHRRRMAMTGVQGTGFLLDLADAVLLRGGDALGLDDGRLIEVVAAPEPLAEIRAADPAELVRIAWHLGNRHLPTQMVGNKLRIRRDHVIEAMVRGLGARVAEIEAPFDPEGGAYTGGSDDHDHDHDHEHADDDPEHAHGAHDHDHHDHGHDHDHHDHHHGHAGHDHAHHGHDHDHHHDHAGHDHSHHDHDHGAHPKAGRGDGGR